MAKTQRRTLWLALALSIAALVSLGCGEVVDDNSTTVEITVVDETGQLNGQYIKSIYDPNDESDFRYSVYDESDYVVFKDVEPGRYRAHATPVQQNSGNWADITIEQGDHYSITFTYFIDAYVTIGNVTVPHYWWKNSVTKH